MAQANSIPLMSLTTYPLPPARMASSIASSEVYDVKIMQRSPGMHDKSSRHSSMPLPSGNQSSSPATSGLAAGIRAIASATDPASPTKSSSGSAPSK